MNKRIYSALAALAVTVSSTFSAFAEYIPFTPPKDNGYFEFFEDFSECTDIAKGGNSYVGIVTNNETKWTDIYQMSVNDSFIKRDDNVKWTVSSIKSPPGGTAFAGAFVDVSDETNKKLYVKGGGSHIAMLRLDLSGALPEGVSVSDLPQESQEFEFKQKTSARMAGVGLFINADDDSYVMFGARNEMNGVDGLSDIPKGAFVLFRQGGSITKLFTYNDVTEGTWKVKIEDGIISWDLNGVWQESYAFDESYIEECKYLAGFFGGGDGNGGSLEYLNYKTGNTYTEDVTEPTEAVYANTFDKTKAVDETEGIYELTEPAIVRRVEYKNYSGDSFALSTDGENWDIFDRTANTEPENRGTWTAVDTSAAGVNRWVNTCNTKLYKYVKVPEGERVSAATGRKLGSIGVYKNVSKNSAVTIRKGNTFDLYLSDGSGWKNSGFDAVSSDTNYVETDSSAQLTKNGYVRLKAKKETYSKDTAGTPITVTVNGNSTYTVNVIVKGPLSDAIEPGGDINAYIESQQLILDVLNAKIKDAKDGVIGAQQSVQAFFNDTDTPYEPDGTTPRKTINDITSCDANDFVNIDERYAERIMTYPEFHVSSFEELENVCDLFAREILVGRFNNADSAERVSEIIEENKDALNLPVNNQYYRKDTDDDDDGKLDDSTYADAIRERLANRVFASEADLRNSINSAVVMAVFNLNSNPEVMMQLFDEYKATLEIAEGSETAAKLDEINADLTKRAAFVQTIKAEAAKAPANFDTPAKIGTYIGAYSTAAPTPTPTPSTSGGTGGGGGGNGGSSVVKTPNTVISQPDKTIAPKVQIFGDVPVDFWGYEAIRFMNAKGAVKGYEDGGFYPDNQITKAEFVQMLMKVFNPNVEITEDYVNPFSDVGEDDWFANSIVRANIYGIFSGNGENAEPNKPITRQEMAALIYRMTEKQGKTLNRLSQVSKFSDESDIADWAYTAVMEMQAAGIVSGDNGRFLPNDNATRAMAAQMLYKTMLGFETPAAEGGAQ